ncbi:uncharacterized protein L201_002665 [Kwoniella dendrophila CBS 6074]|uniref:Uncharacterized protein n=1 Tax=Kwoniella dendrophila CBS 6074 TaxID=1295534 RepID=A0AAX4JS77_9TREE
MKATYLATILLSTTLSLGAPTGLSDIISSQNSISPFDANKNSPIIMTSSPNTGMPISPINQIDSVLVPPALSSSPGSSSSYSAPVYSSPSRPEEYRSGVLVQHNPAQKRGSGLTGDPPLNNLGYLNQNSPSTNGRSNKSNASNDILDSINDRLKSNNANDDNISGISNTLSSTVNGGGGKKRMGKRDLPIEEMGKDHLGRKVVRRGNEFEIQEPEDQGRQWGGANELNDENDEPFYHDSLMN